MFPKIYQDFVYFCTVSFLQPYQSRNHGLTDCTANVCVGASMNVLSPEDCPHRLRLCHMTMSDGDYGFTMYTGTDPTGQFIKDVDRQSPAKRAGLRAGDRVVEVNGVNVETDSHFEASVFDVHCICMYVWEHL